MIRRLLWSVSCALMLSVGLSPVAGADAPSPTVSGPVTGGNGVPIVFSGQPADQLVGRETFDLASVGYSQSEFFVEGMASAYSAVPDRRSPATAAGRSSRRRRPLTGPGWW